MGPEVERLEGDEEDEDEDGDLEALQQQQQQQQQQHERDVLINGNSNGKTLKTQKWKFRTFSLFTCGEAVRS